MLVEDAVNETTGLELVELLDANPEHVVAGVVHLPLVEVVFVHQLEDEIPLFVGACPAISVGLAVGMTISVGGCCFAVAVTIASALLADAVSFIGDESRVLNLLVNALLERLVEACAFGRHLVDVADFCFDSQRKLMTAISRESQAFAVIGDKFECHICSFLLVGFGYKKSPTVMAGLFVLGFVEVRSVIDRIL